MTLFAQLITKHLETETRLSESQTALLSERDTSELREQFIAVLGHDLRTPLSSILLGTELLGGPDATPKTAQVVERMRRSALRISALVNDVMDFTRGRMGGGIALSLARESAMQAAFEQVVAELRGACPERQIEVDLAIDGELYCDGQRLQQLLSNLLKNALVHGDPARPVLVQGKVAAGRFELHVVNGGAPIPQETVAQLFKPFWRASARSPHEGLGLGLFIAAEIARSHGGQLDVVSNAQETRFSFVMQAGASAERCRVSRV